MTILTIIVSILILGLLILSHEFGHFISAKKLGIKVEEFGFGFPPRIFSVKKGETVYSLNLIPFGGFVKIHGEQRPVKLTENLLSKFKKNKRTFYNRPIWQRAIIIAMGVIMNLFLAVVMLSIVNGIGVPTVIENGMQAMPTGRQAKNIQIQIIEIINGSPAKEAGLKAGDTINELKVNGQTLQVSEVDDVQKFVARYAGEKITLIIKRGNETLEKTLVPRISPPLDEGPLGIALAKVGIVKYSFFTAIWRGLKTTAELTITFIGLFYQLLKTLIIHGKLMGEVAGPVGIASIAFQMTKLGISYVLQFIAILSVNLAIINIIPFPALDGGRLLFLAIEKFKGSPVSEKVERLINSLGFALLIVLLALVTFRDVTKLF